MNRRNVCCGALGLLALASGAIANDPLQFGTDIRRCTASYAGNGSGSTWQDRPVAFDPFDGGADIEVTNGLETWVSNSLQNSWMDGSTMAYVGSGTGTAIAVPLSAPLMAQGQSKFDLYFSISEPTEYHLWGTVGELGHADSQAVVRLSVVGGGVINEAISRANATDAFDLSGTLQPGNYRLYAEAMGRGRTTPLLLLSTGSSSCSVVFDAGTEIFDPADWNLDRLVNTADFFDFVTDFAADNADFDHSGETDSQDLFGFLNAFNR
jgi:hypothetical protein